MVLSYKQYMYFQRLWDEYQTDYIYLCRSQTQVNEAMNGWQFLKDKQYTKLKHLSYDSLGDVCFEKTLKFSESKIEKDLQVLINQIEDTMSLVSNMSISLTQRFSES